jgi:hypothetical protein
MQDTNGYNRGGGLGDADPLPSIDMSMPFDPTPITIAILAIAVSLLLIEFGPRISLKGARTILSRITRIF